MKKHSYAKVRKYNALNFFVIENAFFRAETVFCFTTSRQFKITQPRIKVM
jgi:hypothetical protein